MEPQRPLDPAFSPRMATHPPTQQLLPTCRAQPWPCLDRVSASQVCSLQQFMGAEDGTPASYMLGKPLSMEPQPLNFLLFALLSQGLHAQPRLASIWFASGQQAGLMTLNLISVFPHLSHESLMWTLTPPF